MALQQINVGNNPDDGQGESLRTAFQKINQMFTEVYATLASLVGGLALKANLTQVVRTDAAQTVTQAQRLQAAVNGGTLLPVWAELVAPATQVIEGDYIAFTLPRGFILYDATLTFDAADTGSTITATLFRHPPAGEQDVIFTTGGAIADRRFALGVNAAGIALDPGSRISLQITSITEVYEAAATGMALWIRGVWA